MEGLSEPLVFTFSCLQHRHCTFRCMLHPWRSRPGLWLHSRSKCRLSSPRRRRICHRYP